MKTELTDANSTKVEDLKKGDTFWRNTMLYKVVTPYSFDKGYLRAKCIADSLIERFSNPEERMEQY